MPVVNPQRLSIVVSCFKCSCIYNIEWCGIEIEVAHTPDRFEGFDHIEVQSQYRAALPITETGYRSHFIPSEVLVEYDDPVAYVRIWLDQAAESTTWKLAQERDRQLNLF